MFAMSVASCTSVALIQFGAGFGLDCLSLNIFTASNSVVECYQHLIGRVQFKRDIVQGAVWPDCVLRGVCHVCSRVRCFVLGRGHVF